MFSALQGDSLDEPVPDAVSDASLAQVQLVEQARAGDSAAFAVLFAQGCAKDFCTGNGTGKREVIR